MLVTPWFDQLCGSDALSVDLSGFCADTIYFPLNCRKSLILGVPDLSYTFCPFSARVTVGERQEKSMSRQLLETIYSKMCLCYFELSRYSLPAVTATETSLQVNSPNGLRRTSLRDGFSDIPVPTNRMAGLCVLAGGEGVAA